MHLLTYYLGFYVSPKWLLWLIYWAKILFMKSSSTVCGLFLMVSLTTGIFQQTMVYRNRGDTIWLSVGWPPLQKLKFLPLRGHWNSLESGKTPVKTRIMQVVLFYLIIFNILCVFYHWMFGWNRILGHPNLVQDPILPFIIGADSWGLIWSWCFNSNLNPKWNSELKIFTLFIYSHRH